MRRQTLTAIAAMAMTALSTTSVSALSCAPPDPMRSVQWGANQGGNIAAIYGTLTMSENPEEGHLMGTNLATGEIISQQVPILTTCYGPWCGNPLTETITNSLFILSRDKTEGFLQLELDPCGGEIFPDIDGKTLSRITKLLITQ